MNPKILINLVKAGTFAALLTPFMKNMDFYFPFVGPKGLYFMFCAQIVFFSWLVLAWQWKQFRPNLKNPVLAAILLYLGISFVSALFGADFSASFWSKFERMSGILMFFHLSAFTIAISTVFRKNDWKWLFCSNIAVALIIGVQALSDQSVASRGGGFIGNDSFWATYILFNIFIALYLFLSQKSAEGKKIRVFSGIAFLIMVFCLFFEGTQFWNSFIAGNPGIPAIGLVLDIINSGARAAKISFLVGMVFLGVLWLATREKTGLKILGRSILVAAVVGGLILVVLASNQGGAVNKFITAKFGQASIHSRVVVWQIAWKGFIDRPYLGWGPENFNLAFSRHFDSCLGSYECGNDTWYDRAHNIVFDTLVETGALGFASYLLIFFASFYVLWKGFFAKKVGFAQAGVFMALFCAYLLQNLTVFDMVVSYLMWFVCLGFIASLYANVSEDQKIWPQPLQLRKILLPAAAGVICFIFFIMGPTSSDYGAVQAASAPYGSPQGLTLYRDALESSPMGKYQIRLFFASQWLQAISSKEISDKLNRAQVDEMFSFIAGELEKSVSESPLDFQSQLELGRVYNNWGRFDQSKLQLAEESIKKSIALSPNNQQAYWELAQTKIYQMQIDQAIGLARQAYSLYPQSDKAKIVLEQMRKIEAEMVAAKK